MILAIDPGTSLSGFVTMQGSRIISSGELSNAEMLSMVAAHDGDLAIEMVESFGMPVGKEVFQTVRWIGRFQQAFRDPEAARLVYRKEVKLHLCGTARAKDPNVRAAIIDRFGPGKDIAIGRKSSPGPLYGVSGHAWSALAVAMTAASASAA